jgi:hypothetical protein
MEVNYVTGSVLCKIFRLSAPLHIKGQNMLQLKTSVCICEVIPSLVPFPPLAHITCTLVVAVANYEILFL